MSEHGICYIEIPAPNIAKAKAFYRQVFDWKIEDSTLPGMDYAIFQAPGLSGGLDPRLKPTTSGPVLYLKVADIPAKLKEIGSAGGRTLKDKAPVGLEMGFFALFTDACGNLMGLWAKS